MAFPLVADDAGFGPEQVVGEVFPILLKTKEKLFI
jgi:hypothetical protein